MSEHSYDVMSDDEEVASELKKLEELDDSLFLDDIDSLSDIPDPRSKHYRSRGRGSNRGRGRGRGRGIPRGRGGRGKPSKEINIDDWDLNSNDELYLSDSPRDFRESEHSVSKGVYDDLEVSSREDNRLRWDSMSRMSNKPSGQNSRSKEYKGSDFSLHRRDSFEDRPNILKFDKHEKQENKSKDARQLSHDDKPEVFDSRHDPRHKIHRKNSSDGLTFKKDPKFSAKQKFEPRPDSDADEFQRKKIHNSFSKEVEFNKGPHPTRERKDRPMFEKHVSVKHPGPAIHRPRDIRDREPRDLSERRHFEDKDDFVMENLGSRSESPVYGNLSERRRDWSPDRYEGRWESALSRSPSPHRERSSWDESPTSHETDYFHRDFRTPHHYEMERSGYERIESPEILESDIRGNSLSPRPNYISPTHSPVRHEFPYSPRKRSLSPAMHRNMSPSPRMHRSMTPPMSSHHSESSSSRDSWREASPHYPPPRSKPFYDTQQNMPPSGAAPAYVENSYISPAAQTHPSPQVQPQPTPPAGPVQYDSHTTSATYNQGYQQSSFNYEGYYQQQQQPQSSYPVDYNTNIPPQQTQSWQSYGDTSASQSVMPPVPPPPNLSVPPPAPIIGALPQAATSQTAPAQAGSSQQSEEAKKEGIRNEVLQQKKTLVKQRDEYLRKKEVILHELQLLRNQEKELVSEKSRDNEKILKENRKLQVEIQGKLKAVDNVIDMLSGIIKKDKNLLEQKLKSTQKKSSKSTFEETSATSSSGDVFPQSEKMKKQDIESTKLGDSSDSKKSSDEDKPAFNYIYYDPEMHWCHHCDVFPRTAKEYLNHMHTEQHTNLAKEKKNMETPWHKVPIDPEIPIIKGAPSKRTPIRGLQFFIPITGWYCKLCETWIGDLHCASLHLKSKRHAENYVNFAEQNPHWETDWLTDREKAFQRSSDARRRVKPECDTESDEKIDIPLSVNSSHHPEPGFKMSFVKGTKREAEPKQNLENDKSKRFKEEKDKDKKKKKKKDIKKEIQGFYIVGSSSSDSGSNSEESEADDEEKSRSIHIAMRNKAKEVALKQNLSPRELIQMPKSRWDSPDRNKESERGKSEKGFSKTSSDVRGKLLQPVEEDKMLKEWMGHKKENEGEKQFFNDLKDRLKHRKETSSEHEKDDKNRHSNKVSDDRKHDSSRHPSSSSRSSRWDSRTDSRYQRYTHQQGVKNNSSRSDNKDQKDANQQKSLSKDNTSKSHQEQKKNEKDMKSKTGAKAETSNAVFKVPALPVWHNKKDETENSIVENNNRNTQNVATKLSVKQTSESVDKQVDKPKNEQIVIKSRLPFIGRMPVLKSPVKKVNSPENENEKLKQLEKAKKQAQDSIMKQIQEKLKYSVTEITIPPPPVISTFTHKNITKQILKPYNLTLRQLPVVKEKESEPSKLDVQDMDIDDDDIGGKTPSVIESATPVVTKIEKHSQGKKKNVGNKQPAGKPLPKDFQDTLSILYPDNVKGNQNEKHDTSERGKDLEASHPSNDDNSGTKSEFIGLFGPDLFRNPPPQRPEYVLGPMHGPQRPTPMSGPHQSGLLPPPHQSGLLPPPHQSGLLPPPHQSGLLPSPHQPGLISTPHMGSAPVFIPHDTPPMLQPPGELRPHGAPRPVLASHIPGFMSRPKHFQPEHSGILRPPLSEPIRSESDHGNNKKSNNKDLKDNKITDKIDSKSENIDSKPVRSISSINEDDLALLGMDASDMAAQSF